MFHFGAALFNLSHSRENINRFQVVRFTNPDGCAFRSVRGRPRIQEHSSRIRCFYTAFEPHYLSHNINTKEKIRTINVHAPANGRELIRPIDYGRWKQHRSPAVRVRGCENADPKSRLRKEKEQRTSNDKCSPSVAQIAPW